MASIFTFDPDPPRVSSPWATPPPGVRSHLPVIHDPTISTGTPQRSTPVSGALDVVGIDRLEPEPQEGPTEYKLHLLLRKRRSFIRTSTGRQVSGSLRRTDITGASSSSRSNIENIGPMPQASTSESRQHRLEQLTTQLRWRLKQSCSVHIPSNTNHVLPHFFDAANPNSQTLLQRLPPDLEDTKGALYEIGVADDGTFVGLAEDEMAESLNTLRAMASSLGCNVTVQRMVEVGDCEWVEDAYPQDSVPMQVKRGKLWVAEALVRPGQPSNGTEHAPPNRPTEQLRVSLTGSTGSGKSSLLGSLTTGTLDNGRGSSRLSLLRHRHEIASGMTSSITQELVGYYDAFEPDGTSAGSHIVNYGSGDVSSWVEIHAKANGGRLVFLSDSAGHPRFHRTTVRGVVGWDPHWTLVCIPADNPEDSIGRVGTPPLSQDSPSTATGDVDLSHTHLQLCLNLQLPLVLLITKYDLATKGGLKQMLSKALSAIKAAGRTPCIIRKPSTISSGRDLNTITASDFQEVSELANQLKLAPVGIVPILLTSSVNGTGINTLHAFLRDLPLPDDLGNRPGVTDTLFHIEDVYGNQLANSRHASSTSASSEQSVIIGGHLRHGTLRIDDELLLGPYPFDSSPDDSDGGSARGTTPPTRSNKVSPIPTSRSFPGALNRGALRSGSYHNDRRSEWRRVRVTSLRNLRLPVQSLQAGQVGTIGIAPIDMAIVSPAIVRIRKGMVLSKGEPKGSKVIEVIFSGDDARAVGTLSVGSAVVIYVASVRASAKVISVAADTRYNMSTSVTELEDDEIDAFGFGFGGEDEDNDGKSERKPASAAATVTFQFIASKEFVEDEAKVLVLPGGGPGLFGSTERGEKGIAALEGFVGRVIEMY
ncbi:hypothetical protein BU24DRAFT_426871 [Aaosphaeria arxii CBS 175.79]|uniref:Tr-type G domain-containing protein n=1 Tax=Aaosphaeria arxii CBS 175.79 TaxID=1450172 RepID=A0A6A5XFR1_9PLEO|nr:uncharacterized protein BU24DRAFT_426871 [Aaosphaeria arxii CBS 175.79]KAF2011773.1 hypothetical protein BU24DRAFT_426871 [Aaosphaeria arxii CBS 175.79]